MTRGGRFQCWPALLGLVLLAGCQRKADGGGGTSAHAAAMTQAVQTMRAAAAHAAQAAECALTAGTRPAIKKDRLIAILDAAEGATGASDRAAAELVRLDAQCRDRWDRTCDYLTARIAIMADTARDRVGLACGTDGGQTSDGAAAGDPEPTRR